MRSTWLRLDWLKPAYATGAGRALLIILLAAALFGLVLRDPIARAAGWGAALYFAWAAATVWFLTTRPFVIAAWWRVFAGTLGLCFATTGLLGMIAAPIGSPTGHSLGGDLGTLIASAPDEWDWRFNVTAGQYALASLRVAVAYGIALSLFSPPTAYKVSVLAGNAAMGAYGWLAAFGVKLWGAYETFKFRRERRLQGRAGASRSAPAGSGQAAVDSADMASVQPLASGKPTAAVLDRGQAQTGPHPAAFSLASAEAAAIRDAQRPQELTRQAATGGRSAARPAQEPVPEPPPDYAWKMPRLDMLKVAPPGAVRQAEIEATGQLIVETLAQHGIDVSVATVKTGPTVTMYGLNPGWRSNTADPNAIKRVRVDTILAREKDLALALKSPSLRFEAPVPGEAVVGIEVPNHRPALVTMRSVMDSEEFRKFAATAMLPIPLGLSTGGEPVFTDLAKMPHLLVAGATGSGKSVCMNAIITGLLLMRTPYQVRMIMIDPKRVELTPYSGIPHLYTPVVVEPTRAVPILKALISVMMGRFRMLEQAGVKNIAAFNQKAVNKMSYIVAIVDELADLMLTAAGDTERLLVRLAQMGRATGIHLVIATQRPSVDVVTGLIKANFPSRISFAVSSQVDSRTVIDQPGAEKLLGRGDMLFLPVDKPMPQRIQGVFLNDSEVESVIVHWKSAGGPPLPQLEVKTEEDDGHDGSMGEDAEDEQDIVHKAASLARTQKTLSTSLLQRRLRIGYPRAARLMDELEEMGIVGPGEPGKPRQVLLNQ
jgi:S-DNA-T family DNA segregation ATPase FtsK/SpoIIIE